jgi:DNA-binding IclR family transcriptional regulator
MYGASILEWMRQDLDRGLSVTDCARKFNAHPVAIMKTLDRLVAQGTVMRVSGDVDKFYLVDQAAQRVQRTQVLTTFKPLGRAYLDMMQRQWDESKRRAQPCVPVNQL